MKHTLRAFAALATIATSLAAGVAPQKSSPLTEPFKPPLDTVLVADGAAKATVLVPQQAEYAPAAQQFAARMKEAAGVALPTMAEADFVAQRPKLAAVVVFGNAASGPLALRLYANHLIGSDAVHPGADGYELRTIPYALDTRANLLFLGGSSPEAVTAAMDAFFAQLKPGQSVIVPHTIRWACPKMSAAKPLTDADIEGTVAKVEKRLGSFSSDPYRSGCGQFVSAAQTYYLSGDDSYGRLCARLVRLLAKRFAEDKKIHPPTFVMHSIAMAADQVEESAGMTDADRLAAAEWLRQLAERTMGFWEMRQPIKRYMQQKIVPIWNHETYPARSVAHVAQFLKPRYDIPAAEYWEAVVDHLFACQVNCDQPLEDSANYQWSVPAHTLTYVLATGRLQEYLTGPVLAKCMDYAVASHDSLGNEATHGDAWAPFGSCAAKLLTIAATFSHDPSYQWILDRISSRDPSMWSFPTRLEAKPADDHVGLRTLMVHPARVEAFGIEGIPTERALDKAVFRSGWERNADYLMLDGLMVGNHKHCDANAIIRFSTNRRYWLVDMDYIRAATKHHNSITVVRDGVSHDQCSASRGAAQVIAEQPFAAELLHAAGTRDRALTQSRLNDYAGIDWTRTVFWEAKDFFVVIDTLQARRAGDYVMRCFWRTLGEVEIEGSTLHVRQRGERRTGNDDLRVIDDDGRRVVEFATRKAMISFDRKLDAGTYRVNIVAKGLSSGTDSLYLAAPNNPKLAYHLPIGKYGDSAGDWEKSTSSPSIQIASTGVQHFEITLREAPGTCVDKLLLAPEKGEQIVLEAEDMVKNDIEVMDEPEQHFFIVNADGSRLMLRDTFDYGHGGRDGYYDRYPYAGEITRNLAQTHTASLKEGEVLTFANLFYTRGADSAKTLALRPVREGLWAVDGESSAVVGLGPMELDGLKLGHGPFMLTAQGLLMADGTKREPQPALLAKLVQQAKPAPEPAAMPVVDAAKTQPLWRQALKSEVTALAAGKPGVLVGTKQGELALLDPQGAALWQRDAGSRVRSVAFATFAGGRAVALVGTHAGQAKALDATTGQELWSYACEPFHGRTGSVGTIFPADLDGDGAHEVVAGSDNWHYHGLSNKGKLLWRFNAVHACTPGAAGDFDGDGKDDVVAASEYYGLRLCNHAGKRCGGAGGGPVVCATAAFDMDGDGKDEALMAMEDASVRCIRQGKLAWRTNVGGAATAIAPLDIDGDGKPEVICASESFSVYALAAGGSVAWRTQLPEQVASLCVVGDAIVAACDDGQAYVLDRGGKVVGVAALAARPTAVACLDHKTAAVAAGPTVAAIRVTAP